MEELKKRKVGTHGSQRLNQLFSLLGGSLSFLSEMHARTENCTAVPHLSTMVTRYGSGGGGDRGHSSRERG